MKGQDTDNDSESGTDLEPAKEANTNLLLANQLQLMASRLDDLSQAQHNMLAMIMKLQSSHQQHQEEEGEEEDKVQ